MSEQTTVEEKVSTPSDTFEEWYATLPEDKQVLINSKVEPLKSKLGNARHQVKKLEEAINEVKTKERDADELKHSLDNAYKELERIKQEREFFASVPKGIIDPTGAYALAREARLLDDSGKLNEEAFREQFPYMFTEQKQQIKQAGAGARNVPTMKQDIGGYVRAVMTGKA